VANQAGPGRGALLAAAPCFVKQEPDSPASLPMNENPAPTREERLAAKLRENLKRRKAQARDLAAMAPPALSKEGPGR
jgi:hypothetical protein